MSNTLLKLVVIGGVGYLAYKYYYLPKIEKEKKSDEPSFDVNDGKTTFYGNSKSDYVRGFSLPENINDLKSEKVTLIVKPNEKVFNKVGKNSFEADIFKDTKRIVYFDKSTAEPSKYMAEYDELKNKLITDKDYTK
jgi:hypothetical protein